MERSPEDRPSPSAQDQPSAPSDPPGQPPTAHPKPDLSSGDQPAGPGAAGEALAVLTSFGRRLLVLVPVYLAGAMGLSVGFVLFGLALYLGWRRVRDGKERSLRVARQLLDDEERLTAETLYMSHRELPAWVSDPPPRAPRRPGSPPALRSPPGAGARPDAPCPPPRTPRSRSCRGTRASPLRSGKSSTHAAVALPPSGTPLRTGPWAPHSHSRSGGFLRSPVLRAPPPTPPFQSRKVLSFPAVTPGDPRGPSPGALP